MDVQPGVLGLRLSPEMQKMRFFFPSFSYGCADADVSYSAELDKVILRDLTTI